VYFVTLEINLFVQLCYFSSVLLTKSDLTNIVALPNV
jgi:hypothetical protein